MSCEHEGFHTITSSYDRGRRMLTYFRVCDECGARLAEVGRLSYEPRFRPDGGRLPWSMGSEEAGVYGSGSAAEVDSRNGVLYG
jgi:hypothetical protein